MAEEVRNILGAKVVQIDKSFGFFAGRCGDDKGWTQIQPGPGPAQLPFVQIHLHAVCNRPPCVLEAFAIVDGEGSMYSGNTLGGYVDYIGTERSAASSNNGLPILFTLYHACFCVWGGIPLVGFLTGPVHKRISLTCTDTGAVISYQTTYAVLTTQLSTQACHGHENRSGRGRHTISKNKLVHVGHSHVCTNIVMHSLESW